MTQLAKIIDVTETYIPVDPNAFPENMSFSAREDYPTKSAPIIPYEGYNFMPTSYGYKSYFGTDNVLDISALTSRCDEVFIIQTNTFENVLVALCEDGIWTKRGESSGAWTHEIVLTAPAAGSHLSWFYCSIGDTTYCYRAGGSVYYKISPEAVIYEQGTIASAVTGLTATVTLYAGGLMSAGTYDYRIAYKDSSGRLSLPSAIVSATLASAGSVVIRFDKLAAAATNGYRLYRTKAGITTYVDIAQPAVTYPVYQDLNTVTTAVTLPDTTVAAVQYAAYAVQPITPTFLNMTGQLGIFKAGGRLGMWDSENSTGWSSIDDHSEFTPDLETLAGSAIFTEVQGRIVNIKAHGEGFIIYATKSIVYVRQDVAATFQWNPSVVLSGTGISYPHEVAVGTPDTTHYAWTTSGMYEITNGVAKVIIPEVTDFLKEANDPMYLKMLGGRYLTLGIVDPVYINGLVNFVTGTIPPTTYTFPVDASIDDPIPGVTLEGTDICYVASGLDQGAFAEQQVDGEAARAAAGTPAKKAGTTYFPQYTAYFSNAGGKDPADIVWVANDCGTPMPDGSDGLMKPSLGSGGRTDQANQTSSGKTVVAGADAYVDGHWTIERFVAVQEAIWKNDEARRQAFLDAITSRTASQTISTTDALTCSVVPSTTSLCLLGNYIAATGDRRFGFNKCSFWLSRYIMKSYEIKTEMTRYTTCVARQKWVPKDSGGTIMPGYPEYNSGQEVCTALQGAHPQSPWYFVPQTTGDAGYCAVNTGANTNYWPAKEGSIKYDKVQSTIATNKITATVPNVVIDTAYLVLSGFTYTDINNVERTIAPAASCAMPSTPATPPSQTAVTDPSRNPHLPAGIDGTFCSKPFETVTIPAIQADPITWPDTSVVLPGGNFLLQEGSIGPIYPTLAGALVYDTHLKKWGKMKLDYKQLLDYSPINNSSGAIIDQDVFGVEAGALLEDGTITLFDSAPNDSYIKYGKIGYYRLGMTDTEEIKIGFRSPSSGFISVETSLDGRTIESALGNSEAFTDALEHTLNDGPVGRWHNIKVSGNYDIVHLQYRGTVSGRR